MTLLSTLFNWILRVLSWTHLLRKLWPCLISQAQVRQSRSKRAFEAAETDMISKTKPALLVTCWTFYEFIAMKFSFTFGAFWVSTTDIHIYLMHFCSTGVDQPISGQQPSRRLRWPDCCVSNFSSLLSRNVLGNYQESKSLVITIS